MVISPRGSFIVIIVFAILIFFVIPEVFAKCPFELYEKLNWNFDRDCIESVDCFWYECNFHYINPANPWEWDIFPSFKIFDFFLQRLEVLLTQIFHFLKVTLRYFILFVTIVKDVVSLISFLSLILCVENDYWFVWVISIYVTKFVYQD